jgi:hypothetical protein
MKAVYTLITVLALAIGVQSCGDKKEEQTKVEAPAGMITLDLSKYGKPFTIFVPGVPWKYVLERTSLYRSPKIRVTSNYAKATLKPMM